MAERDAGAAEPDARLTEAVWRNRREVRLLTAARAFVAKATRGGVVYDDADLAGLRDALGAYPLRLEVVDPAPVTSAVPVASMSLTAEFFAGATAEAEARNEGLSHDAQQLRALLEGFARLPGYADADGAELAMLLLQVETAGLPRWRRLLAAVRAAW